MIPATQVCFIGRRQTASRAFTRAELLVSLAAVTFVCLVAMPSLANPRPRSQRLTCVSNLREIGQGFASWSSEFGNRPPSHVSANEGGTLNHPSGLQNSAWFHFQTLSNHVRAPRIYVCPADGGKREASNFDIVFNGGFGHPIYRNNALSYFTSHTSFEARVDMLAGDAHLTNWFIGAACQFWIPTRALSRAGGSTASWMTTRHAGSGNIVYTDGRVEQLSNTGLRQRLAEGGSSADSLVDFHFLAP